MKNLVYLFFIIILIFSGCNYNKKIKSEKFVDLKAKLTSGIIFYNDFMLVAKDGELLKITSDKTISVFCSLKDLPEGKDYFFKSPLIWNMVLDKDKNIIAAAQDRILKISPEGKIETLIRKDFNGIIGGSGLEIDNDGNLYVTDGGKILKYDTNLQESEFFDAGKVNESFNALIMLTFSKDRKFLYASNFDLAYNSSALIKIPVEADGKAGKPEVIIDKNTKYSINNRIVSSKGNIWNILFSNKGNLLMSVDLTGYFIRIKKSGKKELIDIKSDSNQLTAFGIKEFNEDYIYYTTLDGTGIYRYKIGEKAEK